jgi:2-polyprenyl-6-methoxyphenol hydroxylase-like FAD-dependent oxidoreductase
MTDTVVIAGAGPGGLMLACELGLLGVPAIVLEPRTEQARNSGGGFIHARAEQLLVQRGIADRFRTETTPRWNRTHFAMIPIDLTGEIGATEYDLIVPQWRAEQLLEARAVELGVDVRRGHRVTGVEQDAGGVTVTVDTPAGTGTLRAAYLVGADGANSAVAELAGFAFDVYAEAYYGVVADVTAFEGNQDEFRSGLYPTGLFATLPLREGALRLMTVEFSAAQAPSEGPVTAQEIRESIGRITGVTPADMPDPIWTDRYGSPTRLARDYRVGRVFLVGDAAHAHPPSSGNGTVTAMHDAVNLGWKLAAAVRGWAPPGLLDSYQEERHEVGRRCCVRAHAQVAATRPMPDVGPLREVLGDLMRFPAVQEHLVRWAIDVRYPLPYHGTGEPPAVLGARYPDVDLGTGRVSDLLHDGRGLLLFLGTEPPGLPDLARYEDRLAVVTSDPVPDLGLAALLVRPDGFVAWADPAGGDTEGLVLALKTWFGLRL